MLSGELPGELKIWRRGSGSNRRIKVLQTSPLPLGYRAPGYSFPTPLIPDSDVQDTLGLLCGVYRRKEIVGAGDRGRTGDIFLGKEALYH
jgi:hypothetical protein